MGTSFWGPSKNSTSAIDAMDGSHNWHRNAPNAFAVTEWYLSRTWLHTAVRTDRTPPLLWDDKPTSQAPDLVSPRLRKPRRLRGSTARRRPLQHHLPRRGASTWHSPTKKAAAAPGFKSAGQAPPPQPKFTFSGCSRSCCRAPLPLHRRAVLFVFGEG
jgi:hypothetical protein